MNISFENKKILITGGSRGIGKEMVKAFVNCKAEKVYAVGRSKEALEALVAEVPRVVPICLDIADWDCTRREIEKIEPVNCLINNAGVAVIEPFLQLKPESFDTSFNINLKAAINISQVVARKMIENKIKGSIVNVSSQASKIALPDHTVYSATKAGIDSLTRSMALELGRYNIRVNTVNPTVVMTEMGKKNWSDSSKADPLLKRIPLGRFAEIEDVVNCVLFLSSEKSAMVNAHNLPVEGGILST